MTQNQENVPVPTTAPHLESFNLVIAGSRETAESVVSKASLKGVQYLDDIMLPKSGIKRGEAIARIINASPYDCTLVLIVDKAWIKALLDAAHPHHLLSKGDHDTAASIWRSIESMLLGHRTNSARDILAIAADLDGQSDNNLLVFSKHESLPAHWFPPAKSHTARPAPQKRPSVEKEFLPPRKSDVRPSVVPAKSRVTNSTPLLDDLYLLCKGCYNNAEHFELRIESDLRRTVHFHIGGAHHVTDEALATYLSKAFCVKSQGTTWRAGDRIQQLAIAGGKGPWPVIKLLVEWLRLLPTRDQNGVAIPQPAVNKELQAFLSM